MEILLNWGADVHAGSLPGKTALRDAALHGHEAIADILLSHEANANARDCRGQTALHSAKQGSSEGVATMLLTAGSDPEAVDQYGLSPAGWTSDGAGKKSRMPL